MLPVYAVTRTNMGRAQKIMSNFWFILFAGGFRVFSIRAVLMTKEANISHFICLKLSQFAMTITEM